MTIEALKVAGSEYVDLLSATGKPWSLQAMGDLSDDYEKGKLVSSLNALGNPFPAEEIEKEFGIERLDGRAAMVQLGEILVKSLAQDVDECLSDAERGTFKRCWFQMIDIGETNALCAHRDVSGNQLPGFVILLNQGLYFCLKLLVTAQLYEDLQGALSEYKRSGAELFRVATELFVEQSPDKLNVGAVFTGKEEVDGVIEAHVSLGSTLLMQFVMLHELGHAHLGHGKLLDRSRMFALSTAGEASEPSPDPDLHSAEFEADAFAWIALARRANDPMKNLGNYYVIRLFFAFLSEVERDLGRPLSGDHPSPKARLAQIEGLFAPDGLSQEHRELFEVQDKLIQSWTS